MTPPLLTLYGSPRMAPVVRRVDEDPRLTTFWRERFPFD
jgi:GST-like protein